MCPTARWVGISGLMRQFSSLSTSHPTAQRVAVGPFPCGEAEQQLMRAGVPVRKGNLHLLSVPSAEENTISPSLEQSYILGGEGHWPCAAYMGSICYCM